MLLPAEDRGGVIQRVLDRHIIPAAFPPFAEDVVDQGRRLLKGRLVLLFRGIDITFFPDVLKVIALDQLLLKVLCGKQS